MQKTFVVYSTGLVTIAASVGAPGNGNINIESGTDFECHFITGVALQASVIVTNWGGSVQLRDAAKNMDFFVTPLRFMEVAGDGRQVYPLKHPRLVSASTVLTVSFVNSVATATEATISLHGYKIPKSSAA